MARFFSRDAYKGVGPSGGLGRARASQINLAQSLILGPTSAGSGRRVPLIYGEERVTGVYLTRPVVDGITLIFAIGWSEGEIEGVQDVYINEDDVPGSNVTITHYTGTDSQTVDSNLAAAISGFNDAFVGVAYSVFQITTTATIDGWPRVEAVVRGIKCYDPRTETTAWTLNPALHLLDFATRAGRTVQGVEALADFAETSYEGDQRIESNFNLDDPLNFEQTMDVFSAYAECLWGFDGDGILVVPDSIVETMPVYGCGGTLSVVDGVAEHEFEEDGTFTAPPMGVTISVYDGETLLWTETLTAGEQVEITTSRTFVAEDETEVLA